MIGRFPSRHLLSGLALVLLALAIWPQAGQAKFLKAIWGPSELPAGTLQCGAGSAERCSAFPVYRSLGVDVFQFQIHWDEIAPTQPARPRNPDDPAYDWTRVDLMVNGARENGIGLAALVMRTPRWANGGRSPIWAPANPRQYADFLYAASERYPAIRHWMIWGEPARAENFLPMRKGQRRGPRAYAALLDRAYGALKQASPSNVVIGGMTLNGGTVMPPEFVRWLRLPNGLPPRMDLWGHNPFDARFPSLADEPLGSFRGLNDLDTLHEEIAAAYKASNRKVPRLWLSEWTIVSDLPLALFSGFYVSRREQAVRIAAAYQIASRTPYVAGLGWFSLMDQTPEEGNARWGLLRASGAPKPAFAAYANAP